MTTQSKWLIGVPALLLFVAIILPHLSKTYGTPSVVKCGMNIRGLGAALQHYADANQNQYPDEPIELVKLKWVSHTQLFCTVHRNEHRDLYYEFSYEDIPKLKQHSSYVYLGQNKSHTTTPSDILLYEKPTLHEDWPHNTMHILYTDGTLKLYSENEARKILKQHGISLP